MEMKYLKYILGVVVVAGIVGVGSWLSQSGSGVGEPGVAVTALCAAHHVDETACTRCNPELVPTFEASGDWCAEHSVPESQCAACHADLAARGVAPPGVDFTDPHYGHDHGEDEGHAGLEPADLVAQVGEFYPGLSIVFRDNQADCPTNEAVISFASAKTAERAGIHAQPVITASVHDHFESPAEVVYDQNETHVLSSSLPISVVRWLAEPGEAVAKGDVLARAESPDMAVLQGDYLESLSDWQVHKRDQDRAADMVAKGLIDSASYERTRASATGARARWVQSESRLSLAGLAEKDMIALREEGGVHSQFSLRAPSDGVLLDRIASLGRMLDSGEPLARIGKPDALWIEGQVRETDAARLHVGQVVEFTSDGRSLGRTPGEIIWISSFLDAKSRTATVRVRPLLTEALRAHQFGRLHMPEGPMEASILVPHDAVQWEGCCNVVFVQEAADRYRPQKVDIATGDGDHYRVLSGLKANDRVVVGGSFLLKTELKKGSIGAGCCGLEAST